MNRGKAYIVGAGPGDPGLITVKGLEVLEQADVIIYDRLINPYLLSRARPDAEWVYVGKGLGSGVGQDDINRLLVENTKAGKKVVRLKGGDPFIFGRGAEEAESLVAHGLDFEIVPGVSSVIAAPAYAGIPLTHRFLSSSFAVITGREEANKEWSSVSWEKVLAGVGTLVLVMGSENLPQTIDRLSSDGLSMEIPVAVIQWGTDPRQRTVVGNLGDIVERVKAADLGAPAVVVIGEVVRLRETLRWFDKKPLFGKRVLVTRPREQASRLSRALAESGAEPVELPTIAIDPPTDWAPLDAALRRISDYDWVIFTSVNPVRMMWERLQHFGLDARSFGGVRVCAVGAATGQALKNHGIDPDFIPDRYTGSDMVKGLGQDLLRGMRVLLPRTDIAPEELMLNLTDAGAQVDQVHAYRTAEAQDSQAKIKELLARGHVDIATFTSSSTVQNLVKLLGDDAPRLLGEITLASIGPVTTRTAESLGLTMNITAEVHTIPGLVAAIVEANAGKEGR